jgi:hypothetical protein
VDGPRQIACRHESALALYPLLDLIEQALMNLDCVIRHAEKACFSAFEPSP